MKDEKDELQDLLHDPNVGVDVTDRKLKLSQAKKITRIINYVGIAIAIWILLPYPYDLAMITGLLFPVIPILVLAKYKYLITIIDYTKNRVRPNISTALLFPTLMLCMKSLASFELLNYTSCILPITLAFIAIAFIFFMALPKTGKGVSRYDYLLIALMGLPYCYGAIVMLNCNFDNSNTVHYQTTVLDKYQSGSKSTTYHLHLKKWGPVPAENEIKISSDEYNHIKPGQTVTVSLRKGLLNMPWYYLK